MSFDIRLGDALTVLRTMPAESVHCCITSPPYWGLRDYGVAGQLGLEESPYRYAEVMTEVFEEVRRVLRDDGTLWLNLGDSYAGSWGAQGRQGETGIKGRTASYERKITAAAKKMHRTGSIPDGSNLKPKDLIGIPWRVALALQDDGWWLRSDIIWHKPNPMPESVTDRPTKAHEYVFLLAKSKSYYYDAESIKEKASPDTHARMGRAHAPYQVPGQPPHGGVAGERKNTNGVNPKAAQNETGSRQNESFTAGISGEVLGSRNKRSVWTLNTMPTRDAHFATFPLELPEICLLAGCPPEGTVLDPFAGAGTTGLACLKHNRNFIGIELKQEYIDIANKRARQNFSLLVGSAL